MNPLSRSRSVLARILGSASPGSLLPDAHDFLHQRVALFLQILFWFFAMFTVIGALKGIALADVAGPVYHDAAVVGVGTFAGVTLYLGLGWLYLRTAKRSMLALHVLESLGTVLACAALAHTVLVLPDSMPEVGFFLAILLALIVRAAVVPSSSSRTAIVSALGFGSIVLASWRRAAALPPGTDDFLATWSWVLFLAWSAIFVGVSAIISRVIYGLEQKVRAAMQLGSYTLDKQIGEGGMGVVYLARHALLRRPTAVKLLRPDKAGEHNIARFEREVQNTSRLAHPNVVEIYDFGRTPDGLFYYAMEYLEGPNLEELIELEGRQPPGRVIYLLAQVAHALTHAHRSGLIHRDIKPANIVVCNPGGVADMAKVLDFGLVKKVDGPADVALSAANTLTGTPLYMSPEQLGDPENIDHRSDLYALGAVGFFLLTGQHVFSGSTVVEVCGHHLHTPPDRPSARIEGDVAADLEDVILKCLAKKPDDRFRDGLAVREALLKCADAKSWDMAKATAWWEVWAEEVRTCCEGKCTHLEQRRELMAAAAALRSAA